MDNKAITKDYKLCSHCYNAAVYKSIRKPTLHLCNKCYIDLVNYFDNEGISFDEYYDIRKLSNVSESDQD